MDMAAPGAALAPGVVEVRRSTLGVLAKVARDPMMAVPIEASRERMVVTRTFGTVRVYITDPALIHDTLVRNADRLHKSDDMKRVLGSALGDGLLTADGQAWRWQRQAIAPAFQHERLQALLSAMIAAAEATRDRWLALPAGATVDLGHEMMETTFAIILDTMLSGPEGMDVAGVEKGVADFLAATPWMFALAILGAPRWIPYPGRGPAMAATRTMRASLLGRISERRAAAGGADDLLGRLLAARDPETGRALDDEQIADNILTFIAAGHETTAVALGWTFMFLARHPECAARLTAEIEAVTGGGAVRPEHVADLAYARQVVSETMRLYPPAPIIARAVARELEVGGVTLPPGSVVYVPIQVVHRHPALWSEPDVFDPDRFAPEAVRARHRFAYLPFGAGPRICIGSQFATMEAVAILAVLAKALRLELFEPVPPPRMRVTLRPTKPLRMRVVTAERGGR